MAKADAKAARGTRDFLPLDMRQRGHVLGIIRDTFEDHGFEPLQTPGFERLDTLLGKCGEEGDQLLFKVLLRGQPLVDGIRRASDHLAQPGAVVTGRSGETAPGAEAMLSDLGLRYDLTVPLARVYAAHQAKLPPVFKCYQVQPVWRADTPGRGRFREFYQCDADVVGSASLLCEVEVLSAGCSCMKKLGFEAFTVRINHRGLLRAVIEKAGVPPDKEIDAIVALDKLEKIGLPGVRKELEERGIRPQAHHPLLEMLSIDADLESLGSRIAGSREGSAAVAAMREVMELSEVTPAAGHLEFSPTLARGMDYYTGCIFELEAPGLESSLGGGGRYDDLIGMFMKRRVPACGFSLGLERILAVMAEREMFPASLQRIDAAVAAASEGEQRSALELCQKLRAAGLRVELIPGALKPGKLRKSADERQIRAAVWLEPGERRAASLWLRSDGSRRGKLGFDRIVEILKGETR
jgi:histidyl-tRNA synthetase